MQEREFEPSEAVIAVLNKTVMRRCREHLSRMSPLAGAYSRIGLELITNLPLDDVRSDCYPQFLYLHGIYGVIGERRAYGTDGQPVPGYYALYGPQGVHEFLDEHKKELDAFIRAHQSGRVH